MKNLKSLLPVILLIVCSTALHSQKVWNEIIDSKSHYEIKGNKLICKKTCMLQINTRMGDNAAKIGLYYSKNDKLNIKEAYIEDAEGNIVRKLKRNEINDVSAVTNSALYSDIYIKFFELKHNTYPYKIVYSYEMETSQFMNVIYLNYAYLNLPILNEEIIIQTPNNQPIKYRQENIEKPEIVNRENDILYKWNISYSPPVNKEISTDHNIIPAPVLEVHPLNFKYGVSGSWDSWKSFGNWVYKLNENRDALPSSEKVKIDQLVNGMSDNLEKIKTLYYYLQDYTRYVNVKIKVGGFQTYPAEYVCTNKYGDCKALTNYMQAMLKHIGVKSYYTLINLDENVEDICTDFPTQAFNHVILTVPINNDTIYLECTSKNTAFGYLGTSIQNRKALLVDKDNSRLIDIPQMKDYNVLSTRNIMAVVSNNMGTVNLSATQRGDSYELFSYINDNIDKNTADKYIRNNILSGSYELIDYELKTENRDLAEITLDVNCNMRNISKKYGNNLSITPFAWNIPTYETPEKRTQHVQIDYPEYKKDTITYEILNNTISKLPDNIKIETPYGFYSLQFSIKNNNNLIVNKEMKIREGRYSIEEYSAFYEFIQTISSIENKNIYIEIQ